MSFCPACGREVPETARFCPNCGANLTRADTLTSQVVSAGNAVATSVASVAPVVAPAASSASAPQAESKFTGGAFANFFRTLVVGFVGAITLGLAYPAMYCWQKRWECDHTYINGKKLVFTGKGGELFGKFILWALLSVITLGIYYIVKGQLALVTWETEHTHFEGYENAAPDEIKSKFDGKWYQLFGVQVVMSLVTTITLTFGLYWAVCYYQRWYTKHKTIDGYQLCFDGKGAQLFGKIFVWTLLTVITVGIYSFWLAVKTKKWLVSHTHIVGAESAPAAVPQQPAQPVVQQVSYQPAPAQPVQAQPAPAAQPAPKKNGCAIAGFVLALLNIPPLNIILSIIGIVKAKKIGSGKGLAVAGLVISILSILSFAAYIFVIPMLTGLSFMEFWTMYYNYIVQLFQQIMGEVMAV